MWSNLWNGARTGVKVCYQRWCDLYAGWGALPAITNPLMQSYKVESKWLRPSSDLLDLTKNTNPSFINKEKEWWIATPDFSCQSRSQLANSGFLSPPSDITQQLRFIPFPEHLCFWELFTAGLQSVPSTCCKLSCRYDYSNLKPGATGKHVGRYFVDHLLVQNTVSALRKCREETLG